MRQTNNAINMLIHAYKAILSNCYINKKLRAGGGKLVFKSLAGALVLGAVLSGSSFAQTISNSEDDPYSQKIDLKNQDVTNNGFINNSDIIINGGNLINKGTIVTQNIDLYTTKFPQITGTIKADKLIFRGRNDISYGDESYIRGNIDISTLHIIDAKKINQTATYWTGLTINDQNVFDGIKSEIIIDSYGKRTGLRIGDQGEESKEFSINASVILSDYTDDNGEDARLEIFNNNVVNIKNIIANRGKGLVQTNNNSVANMLNISVAKDSRLAFQTLKDPNSTDYDSNLADEYISEFKFSNIDLAENAKIQAAFYGVQAPDTKNWYRNDPSARLTGDNVVVRLGKGAVVDFGGYKNKDWFPEDFTVEFKSLSVHVLDSNPEHGSRVYLTGTLDAYGNYKNLKTPVDKIKLIAAASNNTGDADYDLKNLANIIMSNTKEGEGEERHNVLKCIPGVKLEQKPTDIYDGSTAIIAGDCPECTISDLKGIDNSEPPITDVETKPNPNINGIAEMAALGLHVWRNEIDEMHRRVGELRDSSESIDGVWARVNNGQARYGNQDVKNNYTSVQVGYDRQVSPGVWVGGALSYTDGDNDFRYGDGETDLYAFSLYNSWLFGNGIYLDLVGKIGRMKNSFDIQYDAVDSSGDYHTNAVSLSAELGWRCYATESFFVEPQAEMWYGHVFDADYRTSTGIDVDNKSVDSLVGRLGLKLGFDFPDELGSFFLKASVLHDWEGDADFTFRKGDIERSLTESLGGTWYEYGFGADFNPTDKVHLYADIEAGNGGEVDTDYRFNLGARYAF
ncbi:autotransporter outer membrane beta-barrel domain-containing protein [uncultured Succinatimonas sp.]|uniref:autotransporter outer membrane beta-barrel domain-containing protein n=1 Tax=uncultured Succinatimonas sp. TaxID=1262973 RepID=UPI0025E3E5DC|nr:autotransporter outer membrane beta-barrel domain-containing protein [uncultured Succinatimonas sp.]